jgi:(R,R)-butanediol dehydrogenase/meso-butanediol dehydrogenase/diacetyl reductase
MAADGYFKPGDIPGHEFAGEVVGSGSSVTRLRAGDRVCVMPTAGCGHCEHCRAGKFKWCIDQYLRQGAYAEFAVAAAGNCIKLPSTVSISDGALVEPMSVALHGCLRAGIANDMRILVTGAGPIGLAAMFWARRLGAARVVGMAASDRQAMLASRMGIDAFVTDHAEVDRELHRYMGAAPDVVIECSGARGLLNRSMQLVKRGGVVCSLGFCQLDDGVSPVLGLSKDVNLLFSMTYTRREFELAVDAFDEGAAEPGFMITDTIGLGAVPDMFAALGGRTHHCKVHIDPAG